MKTQLIFIILSVLLCACKTQKGTHIIKREDIQQESLLSADASWMQREQLDSSYRYWHYTGDSGFFFHPDLGFWSQSGQLTYIDKKGSYTKDEKGQHQYDNVKIEKTNLQLDSYKIWTSYFMRNWVWFLLLFILAAVYWMYRKFICF
ncbi:hypothetical protein SAMN05660841_04290 [Sphingobacterium nematocida]|uniref:Uncharacterized protein n=1 Tax=Sphingobacterium nematocida TaxID=1513896 RepID=A0A1T5GR53_9SPHI|nr:hypothetical protein [Sphingobacterium nematocida]SKC10886.1 hypothetical protein SAMN05660841_04290 [Sphingobacterium nematocida]